MEIYFVTFKMNEILRTSLLLCFLSYRCIFSCCDIHQKYFKYCRVNRDPGKWLDFNLTFVGFMIFLDALTQKKKHDKALIVVFVADKVKGERRD